MDCLQQNSPITSYKVHYTEASITTGPITTTDTSFVATSLFPGTSYTFEIAAVNKDGDGPYQQFIASTDQSTGMLNISKLILLSNLFFFRCIITQKSKKNQFGLLV